jgi:hypothetical protein
VSILMPSVRLMPITESITKSRYDRYFSGLSLTFIAKVVDRSDFLALALNVDGRGNEIP